MSVNVVHVNNYKEDSIHLFKEFGSWGMTKKLREVVSGDLFVPRSDSFPMNPEQKTLFPYIDPF